MKKILIGVGVVIGLLTVVHFVHMQFFGGHDSHASGQSTEQDAHAGH
jgi:hypothetical protein